MNGIILEKLPLLRREDFSYALPFPFRVREDKERKGAAMKNCKQDIFNYNNRPNQQNSATAMQEINSEDNQSVSVGRSEMDIILPLKTGCHRLPFNPNNCRTDLDCFIQKDKNGRDSFKEHLQNSEQTSNRRQRKYDKNKLEHFATDFSDIPRERGKTNSQLLNGSMISNKGRFYENEIRLKKEIQKKEILLQDKLLKAVETLRKVQIGSTSEDKMKEEQSNAWKSEIGKLGDWESARERALGGRRHEGQREEIVTRNNNLFKGKDGIIREEKHVKDSIVNQKEKRKIQKNTKPAEMEVDYFEKMANHMRKTEKTEKDKTKRERAVEWQGNEMRKWDQSFWQEKEIVRAYDGERRRRERANFRKNTDKEDEDQHWNIMEKTASNPPTKGKDVFNHDKRNVLIKNHLARQNRIHQYKSGAAEEIPSKQPLPNDGPSIQNIESLQQVKLIPESSSNVNFQLLPCEICHRNFKQDRLEKHISICQKIQKNKCKVYDSSQHRIKGTEIEEFLKKNGRSKTPEPKKIKKQDAFIQSVRQARAPAARGVQPREDPYSDYVTCPHCSRRFAPGPAETHIPKCQNIKSRPPPPRQRHRM